MIRACYEWENDILTAESCFISTCLTAYLLWFAHMIQIYLTFWNWLIFQVWFQNRRAKFRKQERLAQQKVTNSSSDSPIKSEGKSVGNTTPKDIKPGSPNSTVSTTPNSSASSHHSNGDIKPLNG